MEKTEITGIVLAGGKSSRFGSDKSMAIYKGKTLIENAIDILKPVCSKVVISSNNPDLASPGCEVWPDELPVQAPMVGIFSCLKRSQTEVNLVISCDMPLIPASLLEYLLSHSSNQESIVPIHNTNRIEPLCGVYKRSLIPLLKKFIDEENYSLQHLLKASQLLSIEINSDLSFFHEKIFSNINTLEDFDRLSH